MNNYRMDFPSEMLPIGESFNLFSDECLKKITIPKGRSLQLGNISVYEDFIIEDSTFINIISTESGNWTAISIIGPVYITSFDIIPPVKIRWNEKIINFLKNLKGT